MPAIQNCPSDLFYLAAARFPPRMDFSAPRALSLESSRRRPPLGGMMPAHLPYLSGLAGLAGLRTCDQITCARSPDQPACELLGVLCQQRTFSNPCSVPVECSLERRCLYKFHISIHKKLPIPAFGYFCFSFSFSTFRPYSKCLVDPYCPYSLLAVFHLLN